MTRFFLASSVGWLAVLLLGASTLRAQTTVQLQLSNSQILIGDQITLTIDISAPQEATLEAIQLEAWAKASNTEVIQSSQLQTVAQQPQQLLHQDVLITHFDTGYHVLPPLAVIYTLNGRRDTAFSGDLGLRVLAPPVNQETTLQPNKDIQEEPLRLIDFLPWLLVVLLIAATVWLILRSRHKAKKEQQFPPPPPVPAHQVALEKLQQLEQEALWQKGEGKAYQSRLTYILREYLENRFDMRALEATTAVINKDLQAAIEDKTMVAQLGRWLEIADMVKFAKATPTAEQHVAALQYIRFFVQQTTPAEVEDTQEDKLNLNVEA
ncbi:MAG: hypothetical protein R2795_20475 [Saprospiraceae bacterium]